jgi:hypothetical protein
MNRGEEKNRGEKRRTNGRSQLFFSYKGKLT